MRSEQFIQLQMDDAAILVLALLDQKHHQERHDRGSRIYDELPSVRIVKERARYDPEDYSKHCDAESDRRACPSCGSSRERVEGARNRVSAGKGRAGLSVSGTV